VCSLTAGECRSAVLLCVALPNSGTGARVAELLLRTHGVLLPEQVRSDAQTPAAA